MYSYHFKSAPDKPLIEQISDNGIPIACLTLVGFAVVVATLGFWQQGAEVGLLLTAPLAASSFLLAQTLPRLAEAMRKGAWVTFLMALVLGVVCLVIEAKLVHSSATHLNTLKPVLETSWLEPAAWGLSVFNVFATYGFARKIMKAKGKSKTKGKGRSKGKTRRQTPQVNGHEIPALH